MGQLQRRKKTLRAALETAPWRQGQVQQLAVLEKKMKSHLPVLEKQPQCLRSKAKTQVSDVGVVLWQRGSAQGMKRYYIPGAA